MAIQRSGRNCFAYVDEAGGNSLPHEGDYNRDYYCICGIIVDEAEKYNAEMKAATIVSKHARTGELKSSKIGNNTDRRIRVLKDIRSAGFFFYALVVDKTKIYRDSGLRWSSSNYKFLHNMFYSRLRRGYFGIEVLADQFGGRGFMESFKKFMQSKSPLFDKYSFLPSPEVPLLQISDVIAGTLRRVFLQKEDRSLLELAGYPSCPIEIWPPNVSEFNQLANNNEESYFDLIIRDHCLSQSRSFVEANIFSDDCSKRIQGQVVRYLLSHYYSHPEEYVYRSEIVKSINESENIDLSEQQLSTNVLAPIREAGIIICSTDKGVKIPYCKADISEWIQRVNSQVVPYLGRLEIARNDILKATGGKLDIIEPEKYLDLARYLKRY